MGSRGDGGLRHRLIVTPLGASRVPWTCLAVPYGRGTPRPRPAAGQSATAAFLEASDIDRRLELTLPAVMAMIRSMNYSDGEMFGSRSDEEMLVEAAVQLLPGLGKALYSAFSDIGTAHGLTPAQVKVQLQLGTRGQMTIGEIATGLACSMPAASELVDRLVDAGHLVRTTDPSDRRRVLIDATPTSAHIAAELHELRQAQMRRALDRLAPEERPVFVKSLRALVAALTDGMGAADPLCPAATTPPLRGIVLMAEPGPHTAVPGYAQPEQQRNPWLILLVLCGAIFMLLLDTTIVNVAQQKIKVGLNADLSQIQWILDSYILAFAVLMLSFGRIGDILRPQEDVHRRDGGLHRGLRVCAAYRAGWPTLSASPGATALIVARVLQGMGGALDDAADPLPDHRRLSAAEAWRGDGRLGFGRGPGRGARPADRRLHRHPLRVGVGLPHQHPGRHRRHPRHPGHRSGIARPAGVRAGSTGAVCLLSAAAIFALVYALIEGPKFGWTSPQTLGLLAFSAVLFVVFVWWERRVADPMVKLELFGIRNFWVANVISIAVSFGMFGIFFPMTVFLQGALGMTPLEAGLTMMPMSLTLMVVAPISGRLSDRIGARWILTTGLTLRHARHRPDHEPGLDHDHLAAVAPGAAHHRGRAWG